MIRFIVVGLLLAAGLAASKSAIALPMYAQRSGRTCGNCHISPTYEDDQGWNNPTLAKRKCNMSCLVCHVNPNGGGLRNSSGRYYGQSTLSIANNQERSYSDYGREMLPAATRNAIVSWFPSSEPKRTRGADSSISPPDQYIPSFYGHVLDGMGQGQTGGLLTFGKPLLSDEPSEYAFWDGRYGDLNADPLFSIGGDFRSAYWSGSGSFFPMQTDVHAALHPIEHLTLMGTLAGRGRVAGPTAVFNQEPFPVFARNAFVMLHELPFMSYAKAGIFMPGFGTYIDDHTSFIREYFEMDVANSEDTALGFEIGTAPNYPFASVSAFRNMTGPTTPDGADAGFGGAFNLGWRDLGWSLTAHGMLKRRDLDARGDLDAIGIAYGFNPFYYSNSIPVTLMGEFSIGRRQIDEAGETRGFYAVYNELWITILNGFSARLKHDFGNRDTKLSAKAAQRFSAGVDVSLFPSLTLIAQVRYLIPETDPSGLDVFISTHYWF